jgi:hypothetical protein
MGVLSIDWRTIMNKLTHLLGALALGAAATVPVLAAVDVGVGITIREPGMYGRIEIGSAPPPPVYYPQPVIITRPAVVVAQPPMYLYVPPGHAKNWRKHCGAYNACGRPVYFVKEDWVQDQYHRAHPGKGPPKHAKGGHGKGRGKDD